MPKKSQKVQWLLNNEWVHSSDKKASIFLAASESQRNNNNKNQVDYQQSYEINVCMQVDNGQLMNWVCVNVEWLLHIHRLHCYMHASLKQRKSTFSTSEESLERARESHEIYYVCCCYTKRFSRHILGSRASSFTICVYVMHFYLNRTSPPVLKIAKFSDVV